MSESTHFNIRNTLLAAGLTLLGQVQAQYDYAPLVPMEEYAKDYRTLDCWECFEARGKMCHDNDYSSMLAITGSSNPGHGICCKPGFEGENCVTNEQTTCSQPVFESDPESVFTDILTETLNHQMFAFCPMVSHRTCGVPHAEG